MDTPAVWSSLRRATFSNTSPEIVTYFVKRAPVLQEIVLKGRKFCKGLSVVSLGQLRMLVLDEGASVDQLRVAKPENSKEIVVIGKEGTSAI